MADIVSPRKRSQMMAGIRGANTKPELLIRRALHARGFRYRLHARELPGRPDLVLPKYRAVIFVHGCFWHGHDCHLFKWPSSREDFWRAKIVANRERDARDLAALGEQGWRVLTVWECTLKGKMRRPFDDLVAAISEWLKSDNPCASFSSVEHSEL